MNRRPVVAILGDLNVDVMIGVGAMPPLGGETHAEASLARGGSAGLTARWLARLGCEVRLAAAVGDDPFGEWIERGMIQDGVSGAWLQRVAGRTTGLCFALIHPGGERTFLTSSGAARDLRWDAIPGSWLEGADWLHLSGYAWLGGAERDAAERAVALARGRGIPVSLDPGAVAGIIRTALDREPGLELVVPNRREIRDLTGESDPQRGVAHLHGRGVRWVAVKLDAEGCFISGPRGEAWSAPYPVEARNATGAGDAFNAGAIVGILSGWGPEEVGALANLLGAAAARRGAGGPVPTRAELLSLLPPAGSSLAAWLQERWIQERR